ncbi:MAG: PaaI family thioesterase [Candidatus Eremiobacteraeota bacterium]|nr:PaaI family thioesterase [Candidatus Eremiobacteraeota bacterium]
MRRPFGNRPVAGVSISNVPVDDGRCFACGPDNPIGLHLHFDRSGAQSAHARITLPADFQGWKDVAHGGIAMALLDEAMAHAAAAAGFRGMTASLTTRFRNPVPLEKPLDIRGEVLWIRRNVLSLRGQVFEAEKLLVEGEGRFVSKGRIDDVDDRRSRE